MRRPCEPTDAAHARRCARWCWTSSTLTSRTPTTSRASPSTTGASRPTRCPSGRSRSRSARSGTTARSTLSSATSTGCALAKPSWTRPSRSARAPTSPTSVPRPASHPPRPACGHCATGSALRRTWNPSSIPPRSVDSLRRRAGADRPALVAQAFGLGESRRGGHARHPRGQDPDGVPHDHGPRGAPAPAPAPARPAAPGGACWRVAVLREGRESAARATYAAHAHVCAAQAYKKQPALNDKQEITDFYDYYSGLQVRPGTRAASRPRATTTSGSDHMACRRLLRGHPLPTGNFKS